MTNSTKEIIELMNHLHDCADQQEMGKGLKKAAEHFSVLEDQLLEAQRKQKQWEQKASLLAAHVERIKDAGNALCELAPANLATNVAKREFRKVVKESPECSFKLLSEQERQQEIHSALWEFHDSYSWGSGATDEELPLYLAGQNLRSFADNYSQSKK